MSKARRVLYRHFSPETNLLYVLFEEDDDLPNLEISGVRMKSAAPDIESVLQASLRTLSPLAGVCLDTCGGLGYSAIAMARDPRVVRVHCFEHDPNVLEAAHHNPASAGLFENPKIDLRLADVFEALDGYPDDTFDRIFHDPPRVSLAGELYSSAFYEKLFRVLRAGGRLFHYTGSPGEKSGKRTRVGIVRRLSEAGFTGVRERPEAQGVSAIKAGPKQADGARARDASSDASR